MTAPLDLLATPRARLASVLADIAEVIGARYHEVTVAEEDLPALADLTQVPVEEVTDLIESIREEWRRNPPKRWLLENRRERRRRLARVRQVARRTVALEEARGRPQRLYGARRETASQRRRRKAAEARARAARSYPDSLGITHHRKEPPTCA